MVSPLSHPASGWSGSLLLLLRVYYLGVHGRRFPCCVYPTSSHYFLLRIVPSSAVTRLHPTHFRSTSRAIAPQQPSLRSVCTGAHTYTSSTWTRRERYGGEYRVIVLRSDAALALAERYYSSVEQTVRGLYLPSHTIILHRLHAGSSFPPPTRAALPVFLRTPGAIGFRIDPFVRGDFR